MECAISLSRLSELQSDGATAGAPAIASAKYYVSNKADRWTVRYDGEDYSYDSSANALMAAIKAANTAVSQGYAAEVTVQGIDGKWRTEWADG